MGKSAVMTDGETGETPNNGAEASDVVVDVGPEHRPTLAKELLRAEAGDIHAVSVSMERAGAEHVTAERVVMTNSGARTIEARSAQVDRSGILAVQSERSVFSTSTIVAVSAQEARIVRSPVLLLKAGNATMEGDSKVGIYAGPLSETIRPLVDARGAAAFGAGVGAALVLLTALLQRVFGVNRRRRT
jgi:hypothetical protein